MLENGGLHTHALPKAPVGGEKHGGEWGFQVAGLLGCWAQLQGGPRWAQGVGQLGDEWLSMKNFLNACHTPTEPVCGPIKQDMVTLIG